MTSELFAKYLDQVVGKRPGALFRNKCLLTLDCATSHDEKNVTDSSIVIVKVS